MTSQLSLKDSVEVFDDQPGSISNHNRAFAGQAQPSPAVVTQ